jgi:hypothetical protein
VGALVVGLVGDEPASIGTPHGPQAPTASRSAAGRTPSCVTQVNLEPPWHSRPPRHGAWPSGCHRHPARGGLDVVLSRRTGRNTKTKIEFHLLLTLRGVPPGGRMPEHVAAWRQQRLREPRRALARENRGVAGSFLPSRTGGWMEPFTRRVADRPTHSQGPGGDPAPAPAIGVPEASPAEVGPGGSEPAAAPHAGLRDTPQTRMAPRDCAGAGSRVTENLRFV